MIVRLAALDEMPIRILAGGDSFDMAIAAGTRQAESKGGGKRRTGQ